MNVYCGIYTENTVVIPHPQHLVLVGFLLSHPGKELGVALAVLRLQVRASVPSIFFKSFEIQTRYKKVLSTIFYNHIIGSSAYAGV